MCIRDSLIIAVQPDTLRNIFLVDREREPIPYKFALVVLAKISEMCIRDRPYTLERTLGWISRQVAPTLKMLKKIDAGNSTSYLKEIEDLSLIHICTCRGETLQQE